ncbi:hypothetical protein ACLB2K_031906 [Fragaria x ananassa]
MDLAASDHSIHNSRIEHVFSPATADGKRVVHDELDFFADHHKGSLKETDQTLEDKEDMAQEKQLDTGLNLLTTYTSTSDKSSTDDGSTSHSMEDHKQTISECETNLVQLEVVQVELGRMNAENQRLRVMITQVNNNYKSLQVHLLEFMQRQQNQPVKQHRMVINGTAPEEKQIMNNIVPRQFMDMGRAGNITHHEKNELVSHSSLDMARLSNYDCSGSPPIVESMDHFKSPVQRGSKRKSGGAEDSSSEGQEFPAGSPGWVPKKIPKLSSGDVDVDHQAAASEETMSMIKKARVSVRARSESSMISDGCQWRKYGQKMAKGNPCPRAYYRCTMGTGCLVRKQVQRCAEDKTIVTTTYEGHHNHPLPPAAMTMVSTTSAAASMILSGSMPSADQHPHHAIINSSSNNFLQGTALHHPQLPNFPPSFATLSASAPFPTVTLDLTRPPTTASETMALNQLPNFSQNLPLPHVLGQALCNSESKLSLLDGLRGLDTTINHSILADKVRAATAAITADPNFAAVLVAAITSIMGNNVHSNNNTNTPNNITTRNSSDDNT